MKLSYLFILVVILLTGVSAETLSSWLAKKHFPKDMSMSFALASSAKKLLGAIGSRHMVIILPTNSAWKQGNSPKLYEKIKNNPSLAEDLIYSTAVEVPKKVTKRSEVKGDITTLSGVPIILEGRKVYFGAYKSDGSVEKKGKPIVIEDQPVLVTDDVTIFATKKFHLPDDQ